LSPRPRDLCSRSAFRRHFRPTSIRIGLAKFVQHRSVGFRQVGFHGVNLLFSNRKESFENPA
jgi:hypothetical protein